MNENFLNALMRRPTQICFQSEIRKDTASCLLRHQERSCGLCDMKTTENRIRNPHLLTDQLDSRHLQS